MDPVKSKSSQSGALSANNDLSEAAPGASQVTLRDPQPISCGAKTGSTPAPGEELAVRALLEAYSRPTTLPFDAASAGAAGLGTAGSASPRTDNNAARTSARDATGAYAEAGYTTSRDGVFAGVAALKTHDPKSGTDAEVFTGSAQLGAQSEVQAGLARVGGTFAGENLDVKVSAEFLTLRVNGGIHNDDDSHAANLGAMATGAGLEATFSHSGWSVTGGLSASIGGAVSSGDRNIDGDETPERCFKGSVGPLTLGFCSEL